MRVPTSARVFYMITSKFSQDYITFIRLLVFRFVIVTKYKIRNIFVLNSLSSVWKMLRSTIFAVFLVLFFSQTSYYGVLSHKILGLFPYPGKSHYIVFDALMVELARRGHDVTVYSTFPKNQKMPNYTDIDIGGCFKLPKGMLSMDQMLKVTFVEFYTTLFESFLPQERDLMTCVPLHRLRDSGKHFDVIITESFGSDFFHLFGYHLKAPVISFHTTFPFPWMFSQTGSPSNPSYIPHLFDEVLPPRMSFLQKLKNTLYYWYICYLFENLSESVNDKIAKKFFGPSIPPLGEVVKNASMMFTATHVSLNRARPIAPNIIEIVGLQIKPSQKLPKVGIMTRNCVFIVERLTTRVLNSSSHLENTRK